jgi:hypothetical protein
MWRPWAAGICLRTAARFVNSTSIAITVAAPAIACRPTQEVACSGTYGAAYGRAFPAPDSSTYTRANQPAGGSVRFSRGAASQSHHGRHCKNSLSHMRLLVFGRPAGQLARNGGFCAPEIILA